MKILHINSVDNSGGAARAAFSLHNGLKKQGHASSMFVASKYSNDPDVKVFLPPQNILSKVKSKIRREINLFQYKHNTKTKPAGYDFFSDIRSQYHSELVEQLPDHDIVNLHWVAGFIDYKYFFCKNPKPIPTIWTLHDMNAFTGGCHYNSGCNKFYNSCGACPQLGSDNTSDFSFQIWQRKYKVYNSIPPYKLHFVTPSQWLFEEIKKSSLLKRFSASLIPYSLDTDIFLPRNAKAFRESLGISNNVKILLFVSDSMANHRKGFAFFSEAIENLTNIENLLLVSVGNGPPKINISIPHLHLGRIENDLFLSLIYSMSDIFIIPSLQDNLPNTVLESFACGTPVIGFDVGGIPDMVRPGITGFLASPQDIDDLRDNIQKALNNPQLLKEMRANCRRIVMEEYSLEIQAQRYLALYQEIIENIIDLH
ncbi:glycosyltransferase family 4 protein [Thermodesulfobacteriota bacterium]